MRSTGKYILSYSIYFVESKCLQRVVLLTWLTVLLIRTWCRWREGHRAAACHQLPQLWLSHKHSEVPVQNIRDVVCSRDSRCRQLAVSVAVPVRHALCWPLGLTHRVPGLSPDPYRAAGTPQGPQQQGPLQQGSAWRHGRQAAEPSKWGPAEWYWRRQLADEAGPQLVD